MENHDKVYLFLITVALVVLCFTVLTACSLICSSHRRRRGSDISSLYNDSHHGCCCCLVGWRRTYAVSTSRRKHRLLSLDFRLICSAVFAFVFGLTKEIVDLWMNGSEWFWCTPSCSFDWLYLFLIVDGVLGGIILLITVHLVICKVLGVSDDDLSVVGDDDPYYINDGHTEAPSVSEASDGEGSTSFDITETEDKTGEDNTDGINVGDVEFGCQSVTNTNTTNTNDDDELPTTSLSSSSLYTTETIKI